MFPDDVRFEQSVPSTEDLLKDQLLTQLAENKRYVFLTVELNDDVVSVKAMTDIGDAEIIQYVLYSALDQIGNMDPDLGVEVPV